MTPRGEQLLRSLQMTMKLLAEHDRVAPSEVDQILSALASHMRNWKPMSMLSFDTGPIPKVDP